MWGFGDPFGYLMHGMNYCLARPWSVVTTNLVALPKTVWVWEYRLLQKCGMWGPCPTLVWEGWGGPTKFFNLVVIGQTVGPWRSYKRTWVLGHTAWIMGWVSKNLPWKDAITCYCVKCSNVVQYCNVTVGRVFDFKNWPNCDLLPKGEGAQKLITSSEDQYPQLKNPKFHWILTTAFELTWAQTGKQTDRQTYKGTEYIIPTTKLLAIIIFGISVNI